jgi:hypothetical protein
MKTSAIMSPDKSISYDLKGFFISKAFGCISIGQYKIRKSVTLYIRHNI